MRGEVKMKKKIVRHRHRKVFRCPACLRSKVDYVVTSTYDAKTQICNKCGAIEMLIFKLIKKARLAGISVREFYERYRDIFFNHTVLNMLGKTNKKEVK